jgi:hypothetical protein
VFADGWFKILISDPKRAETSEPLEQQQPVNEWDKL